MKKIALFAAILASIVLAAACTDEVYIRPSAKITLADGTIISCRKENLLKLTALNDHNHAVAKFSCVDVKGLFIEIPADKVVKIEIVTAVDAVK